MQKRHQDKSAYFQEQVVTTREFVIPYIEKQIQLGKGIRVLEIGCGEGGNLVPFLEKGCDVTGIDISESKINFAEKFLSDVDHDGQLKLIARDIYLSEDILQESYHVIIMRDVIEHIHDQDRFMAFVRNFLGENGIFFLAFPPWYNPFGGHQQICRNRLLSKLPYFHLLPAFIYKLVLKTGGEYKAKIEELLEIKETGISIERFRKILKKHGYKINDETQFLINPNYKVKFGLRPRKQAGIIAAIPFIRNFLTTAIYINVSKQTR